MKFLISIAIAMFLSGCAATRESQCLTYDKYPLAAISVLYNETRNFTYSNISSTVSTNVFISNIVVKTEYYSSLIDDTNFVSATETILMHYATNSNPQIAQKAALRLVGFGTETALRRSFEIAQTDKSPEFRSELWNAIIALLNKQEYIKILHTLSTPAETSDSFESILLDPSLVLSLSHPFNSILPSQVSQEEIEDAIILQYAEDDGKWSVECVDKIPFVPFYKHRYTSSWTVRRAIVDSLSFMWTVSPRIINAFEEFSRNEDPEISEPAKELLEYIKRNQSKRYRCIHKAG